MHYLKIMIVLLLCSNISFSMERPPKRGLYPPVQLDEQPRKKQFWQEPHLLKHGAYLAFVENLSGKELRIAVSPLTPVQEPDESYAFLTHENEAETLDIVYSQHGSQTSKQFFIEPAFASNEISTVEGFCLLIETTQEPPIKKLLWVLRSLDHEERTCAVSSYFDDKPNKTYKENVIKKNPHSKLVTLIHLTVPDSKLSNIKAKTKTFPASNL